MAWTYKKIILVTCFIIITTSVSGFVLLNTYNSNGYTYLFLLPFLYGVFMILFPSMWRYRKGRIGLTVFNIVLLIRYFIYPVAKAATLNDPYFLNYSPTSSGVETGIWIMVLELLFSFIIVHIFAKRIYKQKRNQSDYKPLNSKFILVIFLIVGLGIVARFPSIIDHYNFFIISEGIERTNLSINALFLVVVDLSLIIIPVLILNRFKRKYDRYPSFKYVLLSLIFILPLMMIFKGTSRLSVVIPTIAWLVILIKLYPRYKRVISTFVLTTLIVVFTSLTLYMQFGVTTSNTETDNEFSLSTVSNLVNAYFSGADNMGMAVDMKSVYENNIGLDTLKNDILYNIAGLSQFADNGNTSTLWFNRLIHGYWSSVDQIIPLSGQGYAYFDLLGAPIFLIVTLLLMMFFDNKIANENRIEYTYIYVYFTIRLAMAMMLSFGSIYSAFTNLFLPLIIIFTINRLAVLKKHKAPVRHTFKRGWDITSLN